MQLQSSLRKCNKMDKSTVNMTEYCTPGSSMLKAPLSDAPKSTRGSSIFSSGEAFWNEAIQIADNLFPEADNPLAQAAQDVIYAKSDNMSRHLLDEAACRGRQMESGHSLELIRKHLKSSVNEVSSLPVKNLDFLFEDKNLDVNSPPCATDNSNDHRGSEKSDRGSVNLKGLQIADIVTNSCKAQTKEEMHEIEKTASVHAVTTRKGDSPNQDADSITLHFPINGKRNPTDKNECADIGTRSSIVLLNDRLDLSNWLPPEVCSIYKRRGISRLYPWQVSSNFQITLLEVILELVQSD